MSVKMVYPKGGVHDLAADPDGTHVCARAGCTPATDSSSADGAVEAAIEDAKDKILENVLCLDSDAHRVAFIMVGPIDAALKAIADTASRTATADGARLAFDHIIESWPTPIPDDVIRLLDRVRTHVLTDHLAALTGQGEGA